MHFPCSLLAFKTEDKNLDDFKSFLKLYLGPNIKIDHRNEIYYVLHTYLDNESFSEALLSYASDMIIKINIFGSTIINSNEDYYKALDYTILFSQIKCNKTFYSEKTLIDEALIQNINLNLITTLIFGKLNGDSETLDICSAMFKNDLNITHASKFLYMHRNTLNYKLDNFLKITNYDLRNFSDASTIYFLIQHLKKY